MKFFFLLTLLYPFLSFAQQVESRQVAAGVMLSHDTKGAYLQRVWVADNNWFGGFGVEVIKPKACKTFIQVTLSAGYSFGVPFIAAGAGAGFNTAGQYGAMADIGAGIRVKFIQAAIQYRAAAMPITDQEGSGTVGNGWNLRIGVAFWFLADQFFF